MSQLYLTLLIIIISLLIGLSYGIVSRKKTGATEKLRMLASQVQKRVIKYIIPLALIGTFWGLIIPGKTLFLLPFIGLLSHLIGGISASFVSSCFNHSDRQKGSMFTCGAFTNLTSFGGLIAYFFYSEAGFGLLALFKLFEPFFYYGVGFPIAKLYSSNLKEDKVRAIFDWHLLVKDPLVLLPLGAIILGSLLNYANLERPIVFDIIVPAGIMISTSILLITVGFNINIRATPKYLQEALAISAIKHLLTPVSLAIIGLIAGYHHLNGGLPFKLLIILGAMPVAFNSLIPPSLYGLDLDLANACWIISTTLFLAVVLPVLYIGLVF